jgi:hypothetical protein
MEPHMYKVILPLFLLFFTSTHAQVSISPIKNPSTGFGSNLIFPFIKSSNAKAAHAINAHLQTDMLENSTVITNPHRIFQNRKYISGDKPGQSGYSEMSYKVTMNSPRILSLNFDVEITGAYSYYTTIYYSFNAQTGKPVTAAAVFNSEGLKYLRKYLVKVREKRIAQFIKEDCQDYPDTTYIRETYVNCNKLAEEGKIFVQPKSILFYKDWCFPHGARPFDTDLDIVIPIAQLQKYLTDYGKKLLL